MQPDFIGPGMAGPQVLEVQRLVGVPMTGVYDQATPLAVRGLQVIHNLPMRDGVFDDELRGKILGESS
jgi:hypothetical protein